MYSKHSKSKSNLHANVRQLQRCSLCVLVYHLGRFSRREFYLQNNLMVFNIISTKSSQPDKNVDKDTTNIFDHPDHDDHLGDQERLMFFSPHFSWIFFIFIRLISLFQHKSSPHIGKYRKLR